MKLKLKKKEKREVKRFAEYMVGGGAFFWSGYVIFFVFDKGFGWPLWLVSTLAYLIGWTVNFLIQRYWAFNNPALKKHQTEVTGRYLFISLVNLPINYVILWSLEGIGITPYIGQFVSAGFFTVWNYLWYKFWVFPDKFPRKPAYASGKKSSKRGKR